MVSAAVSSKTAFFQVSRSQPLSYVHYASMYTEVQPEKAQTLHLPHAHEDHPEQRNSMEIHGLSYPPAHPDYIRYSGLHPGTSNCPLLFPEVSESTE